MAAPTKTQVPSAAELEQLLQGTDEELRRAIEAEIRSEFEARVHALEQELAATKAELELERDLDRCISIREAAQIAGVSHDYFYKHKNLLPFVVQMGPKRWVVSRRKLREYLDENGGVFEDPVPPEVTLGTVNRRRSCRPFS